MSGIFNELAKENGEEISNELKDKFLESIDTEKNQEGYYLDAFDKPISFNGIRQLKRPYTKMALTEYQQKEIKACHDDFFYFRKNYCKIITKKGVGRPEPRDYQYELEQQLVTGDDTIINYIRQSGKTVTTAQYLLWCALTRKDINIGIAANVQKLAMEVLDKIKKIYIEMPIWLQPGLMSWNKGSIEFDNGNRIMTAATNSDSFRGFSIHVLYIDECAFVKTNLWEDFADSVFPAQDALAEKQTIISSTPNGLNHYYWLVEGARKGTNGYGIVECDYKQVPRWNKDGSIKDPEVFKKEQIAKNGTIFWNQNFGGEFLGSSATLINGTVLKNIIPVEDDDIIYDTLFDGLRIFDKPKNGHTYILTVDPKIDGADLVGIQVVDVTALPFVQVAVANLTESYLLIPSRVYDLGLYYNQSMIIVENNIDMTIADALYYQYNYEGEVFKETRIDQKNYRAKLGARTTTKTKKNNTSLLKKFIEEGLLIIKDKKTLGELFNFIEKKNGTFSAEEGYHDDLVMSMSLLFFPFNNVKDWDDFKGFVDLVEGRKEAKENEEKELAEFLDLGFNSEDTTFDSPFTEGVWGDDQFSSDSGFYEQDFENR